MSENVPVVSHEVGTHQKDARNQYTRPTQHIDPPCKEPLHNHRHDGAHHCEGEPPIAGVVQLPDAPVVVHEHHKTTFSKQPRLYPFEDKDAVYWLTRL